MFKSDLLRPLGVLLFVWVATPALAQTDTSRRCAVRLSGALLGQSPSAALLGAASPQGSVDAMMADAQFIERFSRFINANLNRTPGATPAEDAAYALSRYVLQNNRPWKEMFVGQYRVDPGSDASADAVVRADTNGLGFFRSPTWMKRYAGNELDGYRIVSAYRIMQNVTGLVLKAALNTDGVNAEGRKAPACAGCHYNMTFGLDYAAKVLSRRVGTGDSMTFAAPTEIPQVLLNGQTIRSDADLVNALVDSMDFRFRTCRLAFLFLHGRAEHTSESAVFNKCLAAFAAQGTMQSAVSVLAKEPSFCF